MEQILVDLYAFANICLLMWYIKRYGWQFSPGLLVLSFYVLVAILAVPAYGALQHDNFFSRYNFRNITFFPYVFLFIITLLFISPTFKFKAYLNNLHISLSERKVKQFVIIYTLCGLVATYCFYRTVTSNVTIETLNQIRQDHYEGETLKAYNNQIEHIMILITVNFNTIAAIIFFYSLAYLRNRLNIWWLIGLGIGVTIPKFLEAVMTASRGLIITEAFLLVLCYSYFSNHYSRKLKKIFYTTGSVLLVVFLIYSLLVTQMRFGEGDAASSSIFSYFGQPTIVFNSQVAGITDFAYGVRFFKPVAEFIGLDVAKITYPISKLWSPCFDTFVGDFYVDFGPIGTFVLALIIPYFVKSIFRKKKSLSIAHLYLMTFYCLSLQHGALVTRSGFCTDIFFCFIVFQLCKLFFRQSNYKRNRQLVTA